MVTYSMALKSRLKKTGSGDWPRAGLPLLSATPCKDCASLGSMKYLKYSMETFWER